MPYEHFEVKNITGPQSSARANTSTAGKSMLKNPSDVVTSRDRDYLPAGKHSFVPYNNEKRVLRNPNWYPLTEREKAELVRQEELMQENANIIEEQMLAEIERKKNLGLSYSQVLGENLQKKHQQEYANLNASIKFRQQEDQHMSKKQIYLLELNLEGRLSRLTAADNTANKFMLDYREKAIKQDTQFTRSTQSQASSSQRFNASGYSTKQAKIAPQQSYSTDTLDDFNKRGQATLSNQRQQ